MGGISSWAEGNSGAEIFFDALEEGIFGGAFGLSSGAAFRAFTAVCFATPVNIKLAPNGDVLEGANYVQKTYRSLFSENGTFTGKTVQDIAAALHSRVLQPSDIPIEYIVRERNKLILNTRSSQVLVQAGIPRSQ